MNRRGFVFAASSAPLAAGAAAAAKPSIFELRYFRLRNGGQVSRTTEFLGKYLLAAAQRLGIGPLGFFSAVIAEQSPFVLALISYPSFDAMADAAERISADKDFQKGFEQYNSPGELSYIRMENSILRGFASMPSIVVPPVEGRRGPRIFELRTYEANSVQASRRKIRMFEEGEIGIFRRLGMNPVFFGETIVGTNLPNLTYMLAYDSLAAREELWAKFARDEEWQKMRSQPEVADALIVSNISNAILRPLPFSQIR
jgi:hypothetical protein